MPARFEKYFSPGPFLALTAALVLLQAAPASASDWTSVDVGSVGLAGGASEANGVWTVQGAGGDIWGAADAFHFVYRHANTINWHLMVRVDDLQNTNAFAKAGLMVRRSLAEDAAGAIVDLKPSGEIEFMVRANDGGQMAYIGGAFVTAPAWVQLVWLRSSTGSAVSVTAFYSQDGVTWSQISHSVDFTASSPPGSPGDVVAGAVVTSHDTSGLNTAHFEGLSSLDSRLTSVDIGATHFTGNASLDLQPSEDLVTVEAAGADVWGTTDSFQFVHFQPVSASSKLSWRVVSLDDTNTFAKAGVMFRDSLSPDAMEVIVDAKPSGEVEFMARLCTGCETTYLGGTNMTLPGYLDLGLHRDADGTTTFTARAGSDVTSLTSIGSVQVPMSTAVLPGFAVTSHDLNQIAKAVFDLQAR